MTESDRRNFLIIAAGSAFLLFTTGLSNADARAALDALADPQGGKKDKKPETKPASKPAAKADNSAAKGYEAGEQKDGAYVLDPSNPPKIDIKTKETPNGAFVKVGSDTVLVAQSKDKKKWYAVSGICTHKACAISWKADDGNFQCPCHGSKFSTDGKVLKKPATDDLTAYDAKEVKSKDGKKAFVRVAKR